MSKLIFSLSVSAGIDIGNFSVKVVQIKKKRFSKETFLTFSIVPIKLNTDNYFQEVSEALKQAIKDVGLETKEVNLSICGPNVITRYLTFPPMRESDLVRSLEFEVEKYIPYKREEVNLDYRILTRLSDGRILVLLIATKRAFIEERVNLIKEAGLEPRLINVDSLALTEAFRVTTYNPKKTFALLDIGYRLSKLVVLENNIPYFSRDIANGEHDILQMISEKLNVDFSSSKKWKDEPQEKEKEVKEAVKLGLGILLNEINLSLEYCERNLEKKVEMIYLSGGGAKAKIVSEVLREVLNLEIIDFWNPLETFKLTNSLSEEEIKDKASLLAVAIGLALS